MDDEEKKQLELIHVGRKVTGTNQFACIIATKGECLFVMDGQKVDPKDIVEILARLSHAAATLPSIVAKQRNMPPEASLGFKIEIAKRIQEIDDSGWSWAKRHKE